MGVLNREFLWGAGSSAYQVEGAWDEDGKSLSVWDAFCRKEGAIQNGETGDVAADAYHRLEEDLELIKALGLKTYRFSVSWPRVLPEGRVDKINEKGLAYYDRLVDGLLEAGVIPFITLYHWDLPLALEKEGGWRNRSTAEAFARYAALIAKHFDGRVKYYITLNEPQCFIGLGYGGGIHAPGLMLSGEELVLCAHHALLAHGLAVAAMRSCCTAPLVIGLASTGKICFPSPGAEEKAAYDATFSMTEDDWTFSHKWLLDAAVYGQYPEDFEEFRRLNQSLSPEDRHIIREPSDFIGLNIYNGIAVDADGKASGNPPGFPRTAMKWPVTPEAMYYGLRFLYNRYRLPLIVTENGQSCNDRIFLDGAVHDPDRIDFLARYLQQMKRAVEEGIPVKGYLHWSLVDNFEWDRGYDERFGLVYVDYGSKRRIIKDSGYWFRELIRNNGDGIL